MLPCIVFRSQAVVGQCYWGKRKSYRDLIKAKFCVLMVLYLSIREMYIIQRKTVF